MTHQKIIDLLNQGYLKKDIPEILGVSYGLVRKVTKGIESKNRYASRKNKTPKIDANCQYCNKKYNTKVSLQQHELRCKSNPKRIEVKPSYGMMGKKGSNQYLKADKLNQLKPVVSEETRKKISDANRKRPPWSEEQRIKQSKSMLKAVENHPESYSTNNIIGRVKQIEYKGILLKGGWEVKTAKWLDYNNIEWKYEPCSYPYEFEGKERRYFPDFFLPEYNVYLEVKGYETEQDRAKWSQLKKDLVIIDKKVVDKLYEYSIIQLLNEHKFLGP
jgi:hypothetical protein